MKEEDKALYNRLIQLLDYFGCDKNTSQFAKGLGINSQNISNIYNRKTIPKLNLVAKIAQKYPTEINYHWLLTGQGKMLPSALQQEGIGRKVDPTGVEETLVEYMKEVREKETSYLVKIQDKDNKIIELQEDLNETNQKIIALLEQQLDKGV